MAQQGNPKDSKTDRYKELVKFSNERNPDFIFREYITGKISRRTAIRSLENTAAYGVLLAGGLAIEEGYSFSK